VESDLVLDAERDVERQEWLQRLLREAAEMEVLKEYPSGHPLAERPARLPRWPSGLGPGFDVVFGGFQGVTILGGDAGVGKSTWSMACALENAHAGALVLYFDAENAAGEQWHRASCWHGGPDAFDRAQERLGMNFRWTLVDNRHSWQTMMLYAAKEILPRHERVLMIFDSMQTICDEIAGGQGMLQVSADLYSRMNRLVRSSDGQIQFLILSELNKEAGVKGGAGKYRGTMVLRIAVEDRIHGSDPTYRIEMLKNRTGRNPGELGTYTLEWQRCRFERVAVT